MTHPTRLSLLAASVLALSAASAVSLFAASDTLQVRTCVEECYRQFDRCIDAGMDEYLCFARYEMCEADCPAAP